MDELDGCVAFAGISTNDPKRSVVWTDYDELKISMADAAMIAKAPELLELVDELLTIVKSRPVEKADQEIIARAEEILK